MCIPIRGGSAAPIPKRSLATPKAPPVKVDKLDTDNSLPEAPQTQIEPLAPNTQAIDEALQDIRGRQKESFNPDQLDFMPDGSTVMQEAEQFSPDQLDFMPDGSTIMQDAEAVAKKAGEQVVGGALGDVKTQVAELEGQLGHLEKKLETFAASAEIYSKSFLEQNAKTLVDGIEQGRAQISHLEGQVQNLTQQMERLGEEKLQQLLGPTQDKIEALQEQLNQANQRLQSALPENVSINLEQMTAEARVKYSLGEVSAELSRAGVSAQGSMEADTFKAVLKASSQTGIEGKIQLDAGAFRALLDVSSQSVGGKVEVNTEALQMLVEVADGEFNADLQAQVNQLKTQLRFGPDGVSGKVEVDSQSFHAVLEASSRSLSGQITVRGDAFEASVQAASNGAVSGRIALNTPTLKVVAELAYKEALSAKLGVETERINLNVGTDGKDIEWSVSGQSQNLTFGLAGENVEMAGTMRIGDVTVEIGMHDTSLDLPPSVVEHMQMMGGEQVQSEMYGVVLSFPL